MADLSEISVEELEEAFAFLDELRESGATNMFGAAPYVQRELGFDGARARAVTAAWMQSFDGESSAGDRARRAKGVVA